MTEMTEYLFVDAGYLNKQLQEWSKKVFDNKPFSLNYQSLFSEYSRVFYYDGVREDPSLERHKGYTNKPGYAEKEDKLRQEREAKLEELASLRQIDNFHIQEGLIVGNKKTLRQKQVDIMIAVQMLQHTIRKNMQKVTLLAGDSDFKPLVDALVMEGMPVTVWSAKESQSDGLIYSADSRKALTAWDCWNHTSDAFLEDFPLPKVRGFSPMEMQSLRYREHLTCNVHSCTFKKWLPKTSDSSALYQLTGLPDLPDGIYEATPVQFEQLCKVAEILSNELSWEEAPRPQNGWKRPR